MREDYAKAIEYLKSGRPKEKAVCFVDNKPFEVDYNFNPPKVRRIEVKKSQDYVVGYNKALNDIYGYLMDIYQADVDKETIGQIIQELKIPKEEW